MTTTLILLSGIGTVLLGRWLFGQWFNHVGLYGLVWSLSLALFYSDLIQYYPLECETLMVVVAGWIAFVFGSAVVVSARYAISCKTHRMPASDRRSRLIDPDILLHILWVMNVIALLDAVYSVQNVSKLLGGVSNILALGNLLYTIRVHEGIPGAIPYIGTIASVSCLFAGFYTSMVGKLRLAAVIPVLAAITSSITNMVRATIIIAMILFVTGYFVGWRGSLRKAEKRFRWSFKRAIAVLAVAALLISGMEVIRGNRGVSEGFQGATSNLRQLSVTAGSFITPSIVLYITVQYGVLNQFLKKNIENPPIGHYSFAPFWRVLAKFGFDTYVEQHPPFYPTPTGANTGSYLRDLYADYGMAGVVLGPFLLGLTASMHWFRLKRTQALVDLVVLGHIYVAVGMSIFVFATQMGVWLGSLIFGLIIAFVSSRVIRRRNAASPIAVGA